MILSVESLAYSTTRWTEKLKLFARPLWGSLDVCELKRSARVCAEFQTKGAPTLLISAHSCVRSGYLSMVYVTCDAPGPTIPAQSPAYLIFSGIR